MANLRLDAHEWAWFREVLLRVPEDERDAKWVSCYEAVDAVCNAILNLRDFIKDPRPLQDESDPLS